MPEIKRKICPFLWFDTQTEESRKILRVDIRRFADQTDRPLGQGGRVTNGAVSFQVALDDTGNPIIDGFTIVTFAEENDKTKLTVRSSGSAMVEYAAAYLKGMDAGWTQSIERLQALLARSV
jgi:uncharacterized protein YndB with AHSA1/START domain